MWSIHSGILFCFLCLQKTSRHFFCVNGTFECIPYIAVEHLLLPYLTVNAVFVESVRPTISKAETAETTRHYKVQVKCNTSSGPERL